MKLIEQVRGVLRAKHYAYRTEQCYVYWITRYIRHHGIKHPNSMGTSEIEQFLIYLVTTDKVATSTQDQGISERHKCKLGGRVFRCMDCIGRVCRAMNATNLRDPFMA
jgi:hypothetical protein